MNRAPFICLLMRVLKSFNITVFWFVNCGNMGLNSLRKVSHLTHQGILAIFLIVPLWDIRIGISHCYSLLLVFSVVLIQVLLYFNSSCILVAVALCWVVTARDSKEVDVLNLKHLRPPYTSCTHCSLYHLCFFYVVPRLLFSFH